MDSLSVSDVLSTRPTAMIASCSVTSCGRVHRWWEREAATTAEISTINTACTCPALDEHVAHVAYAQWPHQHFSRHSALTF